MCNGQTTEKDKASHFSGLRHPAGEKPLRTSQIADQANIGRTTFYAHFETKDELLRAMCADIFHHVFTQELPEEAENTCLNSKSLEIKLSHILFHLQENPLNLKGLLASESGGLFMQFFKGYLHDLFSRYLHNFKVDVPAEFMLHYLVGSFAETVHWWVQKNMVLSPECVAEYYLCVVKSDDPSRR